MLMPKDCSRKELVRESNSGAIHLTSTQTEMFLTEIEKLRGDYQGIDARVIAFDCKGTWVNVASRFVLSPNRRNRPYHHQRSLDGIKELSLIRDTLHIDQLSDLTSIFENGELSLQGKKIQYRRWMNQKWDSPYAPIFYCLGSGDADWNRWDAFAYSLRGSESGSMREFLQPEGVRRIESKLSSLPTPFESLMDLATDYVGSLWVQDVSSSACMEILAPIDVKFIPPLELDGKLATIHYKIANGYPLSKVSVGYVTSQAARVVARGRVTNQTRIREGQNPTYRSTVKIPSTADNLVLFLSYGGQEVDRQTLSRTVVLGENPRMSACARFDPGLEIFGRGVNPQEKKDLKLFEEAVRSLFTFAGFSCLKPLPSDAVDILAFTDNARELVLIECTTGTPDLHNKLGKLANRRNAFRKMTHPVALVATPAMGDEITAGDRDRAKKDGIVLLLREELARLFDMANRGTTPSSVLSYLRTLSPNPFS